MYRQRLLIIIIFFFRVLMLRYLVFTEYKVLGFLLIIPGRTTTEQAYTISGLC